MKALSSLPVRGAWVEISKTPCPKPRMVSLPVRGAWVEIGDGELLITHGRASLPVRGAWVEMIHFHFDVRVTSVAPRAGSVG